MGLRSAQEALRQRSQGSAESIHRAVEHVLKPCHPNTQREFCRERAGRRQPLTDRLRHLPPLRIGDRVQLSVKGQHAGARCGDADLMSHFPGTDRRSAPRCRRRSVRPFVAQLFQTAGGVGLRSGKPSPERFATGSRGENASRPPGTLGVRERRAISPTAARPAQRASGRNGDRVRPDPIKAVGPVAPAYEATARLAGGLLGAADSSSTFDAVVVATAIDAGGAVILTGDADDLGQLSAHNPEVTIEPI